MIVEIASVEAYDVVTKEKVRVTSIYWIMVDGSREGQIGTQPGARPTMFGRWNPKDLEELERQVGELLGDVGGIRQAPEKIPETEKQVVPDDFD